MTLQEIEAITSDYSAKYDQLSRFVEDLESELRKLKRQRRERLKRLVQEASNARAALKLALGDGKDLFDKPRTRILHGVKVGWRKQKGKLTWGDDAQLVKKIRAAYEDDAGVLVATVEKPRRETLEKLPAAELKRLGIAVEDDKDEVVIKAMTGDIDRLVSLLLDEGEDAEDLGEAA